MGFHPPNYPGNRAHTKYILTYYFEFYYVFFRADFDSVARFDVGPIGHEIGSINAGLGVSLPQYKWLFTLLISLRTRYIIIFRHISLCVIMYFLVLIPIPSTDPT